jgi:hypothetical protein
VGNAAMALLFLQTRCPFAHAAALPIWHNSQGPAHREGDVPIGLMPAGRIDASSNVPTLSGPSSAPDLRPRVVTQRG